VMFGNQDERGRLEEFRTLAVSAQAGSTIKRGRARAASATACSYSHVSPSHLLQIASSTFPLACTSFNIFNSIQLPKILDYQRSKYLAPSTNGVRRKSYEDLRRA
jgi:hypothetical protein